MYLRLNREIMRWFDYLYEERRLKFEIDEFTFLLKENAENTGNVLSIAKKNSKYWMLEFELNNGYVQRLRSNVHPIFGEYIYDQVSIYMDDVIYDRLNRYIGSVFESVLRLEYSNDEMGYVMAYNENFVSLSKEIEYNQKNRISNDLNMVAKRDGEILFQNDDNTVRLSIKYDPGKGEGPIDSLFDLRKSLVFYR